MLFHAFRTAHSTDTPPTSATLQSNFEQGVALALHLWPALTYAVQNNWGGPDSEDKRAWFAGAIVELFPDIATLSPAARQQQTQLPTTVQPHQSNGASAAITGPTEEPDDVDVETVLLQVMLDEFDVNVEDDSAFEVAQQVIRVRGECLRGGPKFDELESLQRRFDARKGTKIEGVFTHGEDEDDETSDDDASDEEEEDDDIEMGDAAPVKEKEEPEVDEEGFTKVTRKKR